MSLQAFEGLSDREAVDRLGFDLRWQAAAGVAIGTEPFHPTVLVGARDRLRTSSLPRRLFDDTKVVAKTTGALGQRARVLDSKPIFDAVATEDTVTQVRASIRKLLVALDQSADPLAAEVRNALARDDEYAGVVEELISPYSSNVTTSLKTTLSTPNVPFARAFPTTLSRKVSIRLTMSSLRGTAVLLFGQYEHGRFRLWSRHLPRLISNARHRTNS